MGIERDISLGFLGVCAAMSVACGSEAPTASPDVEDNQGAVVLFEEAYSDTGSLVVVRDNEGQLGIGVRGKIGVDDPSEVEFAMSKDTLADTYRSLRPDIDSVPDELEALSGELTEQRASALARLAESEVRFDPDAMASIPKDSNAFYANACVLIGGGFSGYYPAYCSYQYNWHSICSYNTIGSLDRSFGWNESPYYSSHTLSGMSWVQSIPPWTFYWAEWGGSYTNRYSCLTLSGSTTQGNIGITHHDYFTDQAWNPVHN